MLSRRMCHTASLRTPLKKQFARQLQGQSVRAIERTTLRTGSVSTPPLVDREGEDRDDAEEADLVAYLEVAREHGDEHEEREARQGAEEPAGDETLTVRGGVSGQHRGSSRSREANGGRRARSETKNGAARSVLTHAPRISLRVL